MDDLPNSQELARLVMSAVAELHNRGYGKLKLSAYVKDGIGAWRHMLVAGYSFPSPEHRPVIIASGSIPGGAIAQGTTAEEMADQIEEHYSRELAAAKGSDEVDVTWYRNMLDSSESAVLEMEVPWNATLDGRRIHAPYKVS